MEKLTYSQQLEAIAEWIEEDGVNRRADQCDTLRTIANKIHRIQTWIDAYPLKIFPDPNFKRAHEILMGHGISLDSISASNMRHVLNGIKEILEG